MAYDLTDGPKPGWTTQDFMRAWKKRGDVLDQNFSLSLPKQVAGITAKKQWIARSKGKITAIYTTVATAVATGTATLAVSCGGNNALSAATSNLASGHAVNTQVSETLTSTAANLQFEAGDVIEVTWVTGDGVGGGSGAVGDSEVLFHWEPID